MDTTQLEHTSPRASRSRTGSKIPGIFSRGLSEISESDNNARATANPTQLPVPENGSLKHKPSNLPEPASKRKTLAERAGEIGRGAASFNTYAKAMTASSARNPSASSAGSSRSGSTLSSRNPSGQSMFSGSVGPGATRPPSHDGYKSASYKRHGRNAFSVSESRPNTALGNFAGANGNATLDSRNGMPNFSRPPKNNPSLPLQKQRKRQDAKSDSIYSSNTGQLHNSHHRSHTFRDVSITSGMQNLSLTAWDTKSRLENMEQDMKQLYGLKEQIDAATTDRSNLQEQVTFQKLRINELETIRSQLSGTNESLRSTNSDLKENNDSLQASNSGLRTYLENIKTQLYNANYELDASRRTHKFDVEDLERKHRGEVEEIHDKHKRDKEAVLRDSREEIERLIKAHKEELAELERQLRGNLENEQAQRLKEVQDIADELSREREKAEQSFADKDREAQNSRDELAMLRASLETEKALSAGLKEKITESTTQAASLESSMQAMKAKVNFLESDSHAQSHAFGDLNKRMQEAIASAEEAHAKLRAEETLRRKLHNQVQELKGNIRVFCRVRPTLDSEVDEPAKISYPDSGEDSKEVVVMGQEQKSSLGNVTTSKNGFSFDRVFAPSSQNAEIFEEISQLVQSALDGYNVCIFCYGQTGSGKTHTMSSADGMIPLAVNQIYTTATSLVEKGWTYTMEGSFVEVYNENINDLLGKADDLDKKKHDIRHDIQKGKTTITDVTTMALDSPTTLQSLLDRASKNRSVAATKANERSSRSHSVFILKLAGSNHITGEQSEGVLNLVDLAGSERLTHSGATGERLKETQNINRSLSCLGDVVAALGQGKEGAHIPYRNSKLTYLLQHSLGGNSKTLMFVMISPLMAHLSETLTSLKFATKVHNTHIGTAKKQTRVA